MGWGTRALAALIGLVALGLGIWQISLLALFYLFYSFKVPRAQKALTLKRQVLARPGRPWGRYTFGAALFLLSAVALGEGGTLSPVVFFLGGLASFFLPNIRRSPLANQVVPFRESILLRSRPFPFAWYALAEVKLEVQDQTRGVSAMVGRILVFGGKNPTTFQVLKVYALTHRGAEGKALKTLRRETRLLSQRGAHLLPLDSIDAAKTLSLKLERLPTGTEGFEAVSSLPFDVFSLDTKEGLVLRFRAFRVLETAGLASVPPADISLERQPLFAEVVEEIARKQGWPVPDMYSPFLAAVDASRSAPLVDRFRTKGEDAGRVAVETPSGLEVSLTRAQLRAVARIYG